MTTHSIFKGLLRPVLVSAVFFARVIMGIDRLAFVDLLVEAAQHYTKEA